MKKTLGIYIYEALEKGVKQKTLVLEVEEVLFRRVTTIMDERIAKFQN